MSHEFGDLLSQHLHRRHGLSQSKLAAGILQQPSVITGMCQGRRLRGPAARERVIAIIGWLREQGALDTVEEANRLLAAAGMAPLSEPELAAAKLSPIAVVMMAGRSPPPQSPQPPKTNLPSQLTPFIGREHEMVEVKRLIGANRLVTLTGSGGVGKTRLAVEVGAALVDAFADGVWLVELASLADPALVPRAVATVLDLPDQPGRAPVDALTTYLRDKRLLLILDNCEHLIRACAELAEALLRACPRLHILATSREALRAAGEVAWRVPSLTTPDPAHPPPLEQALDYEAVRLFVEHAAAVRPDFALTPEGVAAVAQVCARLDGIPLALVMAAAWVSTMTVQEIAARLDDRFTLLASGSRTAPPRHQTLRATLDWSYGLLAEPERVLLERMSAFAGGWTADAARAVAIDAVQLTASPAEVGGSGATDVLRLLLGLVRKSLVQATAQEDGTRYAMLETVRQYAAERLRESGESVATRDLHLCYFLSMVEETMDLGGTHVDAWVRRLDPEYDNLRAAFDWARARDDRGETALRLAAALRPYWARRGHIGEGMGWLEAALARGDSAPAAARARALLALATQTRAQGALTRAVSTGEVALALFRQTDDRLGLAWCLELLANNLNDARVAELAEEALVDRQD
jgi:predicted ATPase